MSTSEIHWLHIFATFDPGGQQVRTAQIWSRMPRHYRHTVVAMDGNTGTTELLAPDVRIELLSPPKDRGLRGVARWAADLIKQQRADLLLTYNWGAIESLLGAWWRRERAVVHHEEGFGPEEAVDLLPRRNLFRRLVLRRVRTLIVPSRTLERIAHDVWRQPAKRVCYLPNGADLQQFAAGERAPGPLVIGNVSHLRKEKNHAALIRAFAGMQQRDARLLIVGDGGEREPCEQLARELSVADRVEFRGSVHDPAPAYREMDVFALPSRTEQMPIVLLEAMATGLPVVANAVGDVLEMVAEPNRPYVVTRDDEAALTAALDAVAGDPTLRAELGAANRARCERDFEVETCLARYVETYERAQWGR
ncbi:MAG: glycosyltransferase [Planctomycetota bacterium]